MRQVLVRVTTSIEERHPGLLAKCFEIVRIFLAEGQERSNARARGDQHNRRPGDRRCNRNAKVLVDAEKDQSIQPCSKLQQLAVDVTITKRLKRFTPCPEGFLSLLDVPVAKVQARIDIHTIVLLGERRLKLVWSKLINHNYLEELARKVTEQTRRHAAKVIDKVVGNAEGNVELFKLLITAG